MAISDITLTAGMRQNLVSLQETVSLLSRTQSRLATGKKVNSALDNPTSFFAAQALNARASDIDSLKDSMGQAIQTIQAADKGVKAITSLIEQAKGIAQQAQAATAGSGIKTMDLTLKGIQTGDSFTIGDQTLVADTDFDVGANDSITAANLVAALNAAGGTVEATSINGGTISLAFADGATDMTVNDVDYTPDDTGSVTETVKAAADDELGALQTSYNSIMTQIGNVVSDSGYKGNNLLTTATQLNVKFEGSNSLTVAGFDASVTGLGLADAAWTDPTDAATNVDDLNSALTKLRSNSSAMSANLSIITTRQDFSTDMINVLTEGSGKLTLADTNEEGANMLMLQTRQSLSTTALSMASQAAQSVLRLFG